MRPPRDVNSSYYSLDQKRHTSKARPTTCYTNGRANISQNADIRQHLVSAKKRNIMSAIPRGRPTSNYKRVSIRQATQKAMRHGKFSKFLDFLLEIKNDAQNTSTDEIMSIVQEPAEYYGSNMSEKYKSQTNSSVPTNQRRKVQKKQLADYYIFAIAQEAENYFKLDEVRKQKIKCSLLSQLQAERRKYDKAMVGHTIYFYRFNRRIRIR